MANKELYVEREKFLLEQLSEGGLDDKQRKVCHEELMDIRSQLSRMDENGLKEREYEEKLKNQKFNDTMRIVEVVMPIVKGLGGAFFVIGTMQIVNNYEKEGVYSTGMGKTVSNIPGRVLSRIFKL